LAVVTFNTNSFLRTLGMRKFLMIFFTIVSYSITNQEPGFAKAKRSFTRTSARSHKSVSKYSGKGSRLKKFRLHFRLFSARHHTHFLEVDPRNFETENNTLSDPDTLGHVYYSKLLNLNVDSTADVHLYNQVQNWIGTPYLLGGDTHWGIDCSRFAGRIYNSAYNILLGSNCREIFQQVAPLDRASLKEGDLVFFKIHSHSITHMGVYLGSNRFVHSSSSRGVIISNLEDPYYKRFFFKGGRIDYLESASSSNAVK